MAYPCASPCAPAQDEPLLRHCINQAEAAVKARLKAVQLHRTELAAVLQPDRLCSCLLLALLNWVCTRKLRPVSSNHAASWLSTHLMLFLLKQPAQQVFLITVCQQTSSVPNTIGECSL